MSTATSRLRLIKQAYNTNPESWGSELNGGALDMADEAWGLTEVTVAGDVTLTVNDYISDQARSFVIEATGAGGFAVTVPAVEKPYMVVNDCSADITILPSGGSAATVRAGTTAFVYVNGTVARAIDPTLDEIKTAAANVALGGNKLTGVGTATAATDAATLSNRPEQFATPTGPLAMGAQKITGLGAATDATDAASLANRLDQFAAPTASVSFGSQLATNVADPVSAQDAATRAYVLASIASATVTTPVQTGNAGKFLSTDGTTPAWADIIAGTGLTESGTDGSDKTYAVDVASDANLRAGTASKIPDASGLTTARAVVTLTDGATIAPDFNAGRNFTVTLGGNRTLANPTNQAAGQAGYIRVIQDGTGSRTLSYGTNWKFSGGAPTLSTTAAAVDVIAYEVVASGTILATFAGEFS